MINQKTYNQKSLKSLIRKELTEALDLLEISTRRRIPASITSPQNLELARTFEDALNSYFGELARFDIPSVATMNAVIDILDSQLNSIVSGNIARAYIQGSIETLQWGQTKTGKPIFFEGPPMQQAIDWANEHGAELVKNINEETRSKLSKVIADGIENKRGVDGIARDIRTAIADMSPTRSKLISHTETGNALGQSVLDRSIDMGVNGKEWILGSGGRTGNCDECIANSEAGVIPIDQEFPSGVMTVLQHPGCTCAVLPAMIKEP